MTVIKKVIRKEVVYGVYLFVLSYYINHLRKWKHGKYDKNYNKR